MGYAQIILYDNFTKAKASANFRKKIIQTARRTLACDLVHNYGNYGNTVFAPLRQIPTVLLKLPFVFVILS